MRKTTGNTGADAATRSRPGPIEARGTSPHFTCKVFPDYRAMSRAAADWLAAEIERKPDSLLCLATGSSPALTYELLAAQAAERPELFRKARILKLDEWGGLPMSHPSTCESYLRERLVKPLGLKRDRFFGWRSQPADPEAECRRIESWLQRHGPIDLCVLGLGLNGHLGFNEPAPALRPGPHVARLSRTSLTHSMLRGGAEGLLHGLTLGMADILRAAKALLLVSGAPKRRPMRRLLARRIAPGFPASFLWLHPSWTLLCDRAAACGMAVPRRE